MAKLKLKYKLNPLLVGHGLREMLAARKDRRYTATWYSGATSGNNWVSQPETLCIIDTITGNEEWLMSRTANCSTIYNTDISPANPWSGDGKRLGYFSTKPTDGAFGRASGSDLDGTDVKASPFVVRSDGSFPHICVDAADRTWGSNGFVYFIWNPAVRDIFYTFGGINNGRSENRYSIFKNTVSDASISYASLTTLPDIGGYGYSFFKVISPTGKRVIAKGATYNPAVVYPEGSAGPLTANGWNIDRGQNSQWGNCPTAAMHDMYFPSDLFCCFVFSNTGPVTFYKYNTTGTDTDGGPLYDPDDVTYSVWNEREVEPMMTDRAAWPPFYSNIPYWGHPGFDRWGRCVLINESVNTGGRMTYDYVNRTYPATGDRTLDQNSNLGGSHCDWNAWSDYGSASQNSPGYLCTFRYNKVHSSQEQDNLVVCYYYGNCNNSNSYHWTSIARQCQSPDGTKLSHSLNYFTSKKNSGDIAWACAYFPHPPEITQASYSSGIVIRFDWRLATSPRGYTARGWPSEASNDPPPPRETRRFRLWRSSDTYSWSAQGTVDAGVFERFDFTGDAGWTGNSYWEIADTPADGTWYYGVTSEEWSGLESRCLSNIWKVVLASGVITNGSGAGEQAKAYPSNPKVSSNFYKTAPSSMSAPTVTHKQSPATADGQYTITFSKHASSIIRYYNIYAQDGSAPTAVQARRIASIPSTVVSESTYSWVDWLGDPGGTTQYIVTAVDYQGNESA